MIQTSPWFTLRLPPVVTYSGFIPWQDKTAVSELLERDLDPSPIRQFEKWFADAVAANVEAPEAMTLATAAPDGAPSARMVLLKGVDHRGFVFFTNYESQKGRELAANPRAALVFYWTPLHRQVRVTGSVAQVSRDESERYFHSRPFTSQIGALASRQSTVLASREEFDECVAQLEANFADATVPLPPYWGGFRVSPETVEFWQGRANRLHDRLRYSRHGNNGWTVERLSP
jgi:pyridoxamine 5'-phosphate oxidase